jgi:hypothetical protein
MATLQQVLRAEERCDLSLASLFTNPVAFVGRVLESVSPMYAYGLAEPKPLPAITLDSKELSQELRKCSSEVDQLETRRNAVLIEEEVGARLQTLLRYLPGVVDSQGWDAALIASTAQACMALSCASIPQSSAPLNIVYHSVLSSLKDLETPSPSIALSMLRMVDRWPDLQSYVVKKIEYGRDTPYAQSTVEIARDVVNAMSVRLSGEWSDPEFVGKLDERSQRFIKRANELLDTSVTIKALWAA